MTRRRLARTAGSALLAALLGASASACSTAPAGGRTGASAGSSSDASQDAGATNGTTTTDAYAATGAGMLTGEARRAKPLVYVPNQQGGSVDVVDPRTYKVITRHNVPASPEHVVPGPDLRRLWVNSDKGNALTPIDGRTGAFGKPVPVRDPYNLYFTPDGAHALVMASRFKAIDVRDPNTMALQKSIRVPMCAGVNHADYSADLKTLVASCEFNGHLVVIDVPSLTVRKSIDLNAITTPGATTAMQAHMMGGPRHGLARGANSMPQDVRLSPDGRWILVADMMRNGIWFVDARTFAYDHFVPTGLGAHGIYPSRDAKRYFVSNRDVGTITVFSAASDQPVATWRIPGHATPDMGGVTADGTQLWLSGRYSGEVYVIDTTSGKLLHRIPAGASPHGLLVWPQPGRISLGHTGNMR